MNKSTNAYDRFRESTMESVKSCTLRGQLELVTSDNPIDIGLVEPASEIVKRFATGGHLIHSFFHSLMHLTTGPQALPK